MPRIVSIEEERPKISIGVNRDVESPYDDKLYNTGTLYNKAINYSDSVAVGIYPKISLVSEAVPGIIEIDGGGETWYIALDGMPMGLLLTLTYSEKQT